MPFTPRPSFPADKLKVIVAIIIDTSIAVHIIHAGKAECN
jgi:hypothetical protein